MEVHHKSSTKAVTAVLFTSWPSYFCTLLDLPHTFNTSTEDGVDPVQHHNVISTGQGAVHQGLPVHEPMYIVAYPNVVLTSFDV